METDHYQTLGLSPSATAQQIKEAYRSLVRLHHPDANPDRREESEALMKDVLRAYATLSDPQKREIYDRDERIREIERVQNGGNVRVIHHPSTQTKSSEAPKSLIARVRLALGDSSETFAGKLGLSEPVLAEYERRDGVPQTPIQLRTFTNLVDMAATKLEAAGKSGEAADMRTALSRKKNNRSFFR
jgi:curved DNA-binding protein CbpA